MTPAIARQMMRIAAARLDRSVTANAFVQMLDELVDLVVDGSSPPAEPEAAGDPVETGPAGGNGAESRPPAPDVDDGFEPRSLGDITYDERVRIRARYDKALEGRQRAPFGWLDSMAAEYNTARAAIKAICARTDGT